MSSQWPSDFPSPLASHSGETSSGLLNRDEVLWPTRNRYVPDEREDMSVVLSVSQWSQFREWVEVSLNGGCDLFEANWISSLGLADDYSAARIIMPYRSEYLKGHWLVSFTLELQSNFAGGHFDSETESSS